MFLKTFKNFEDCLKFNSLNQEQLIDKLSDE